MSVSENSRVNPTANSLSVRRRALNIVWTAAGEYGFDPVFLAFSQDAQPDFYMNSIIGYVRKWYDSQIMKELFDAVEQSFLKETFDGLLWIGLENCAFEREVEQRPVLSELRIACARSFFEQQLRRSRQQWMAQNSLVYALQAARWRTVLGKSPALSNPWERKLFDELAYSKDWDARQIADHTYSIFRRFFHCRGNGSPLSGALRLRAGLSHRFSRFMPSRVMRAEELTFGRDGAANGMVTARKSPKPWLISAAEEEENRIYIENCFGLPLYGRPESEQIELALCTDRHAGCHLYFTTGQRPSALPSDPLTRKAVRGAQEQEQRNRAHYRERSHFYQNSIQRLSRQIQNALLVYPQPMKVPARTGLLSPSLIWRAVRLNDERIFTDIFQSDEPDFSVDLLLDASASRLQSQEIIAAQAYVIAQSLKSCQIPVQVSSFLSLRGHTIIRRFCGYSEADRQDRIFDYFAAGWNRDGLALRGCRHLMEDSPSKKRLLILLTDASPNDDRRIPPDLENGFFTGREYSGDAGVEDTAAEVRLLKKNGVQVMAILNGEDGSPEAARKIYGEDFVRIENIRHLSDGVGMLLQKQIERMQDR